MYEYVCSADPDDYKTYGTLAEALEQAFKDLRAGKGTPYTISFDGEIVLYSMEIREIYERWGKCHEKD